MRTPKMTLNPAHPLNTRALSIVLIAAFAGVALWLFAPWAGGSGDWNGAGGSDSSAALPPSLRLDGAVQHEVTDGVVTKLIVPLVLRGETGIALDGRMRAETVMGEGASAAVPATFSSEWVDGNGDTVLDPGEHVMLTVNLPGHTTVYPDNPLRLVIKTSDGGSLIIEDVLP